MNLMSGVEIKSSKDKIILYLALTVDGSPRFVRPKESDVQDVHKAAKTRYEASLGPMISPFRRSEQNCSTIPFKLFEYLKVEVKTDT